MLTYALGEGGPVELAARAGRRLPETEALHAEIHVLPPLRLADAQAGPAGGRRGPIHLIGGKPGLSVRLVVPARPPEPKR